ncbi:MAG: deoxyribodipyrimidine photo-lyase [Gammaproteobacteria bacterium]|nr:deoxyribodipyrimidine photo-lyase [Gammaproteobacteria bacterium]
MDTVIVWFRRDLRLADNPALAAAMAAGARVIPVWIDTREDEGDWPPGAAAQWWLHHSLAALQAALAALGSQLVIRGGPALRALEALVEHTGATGVYWNRLYEPASVARDTAVKEALRARGVTAESFQASLLVEPWRVATGEGKPYRVFSPFWRNARRQVAPRPPQTPPKSLNAPQAWPESLALEALGLLPRLNWADDFGEHWTPGEAGAHAALERFLDGPLGDYAQARELPAVAGSSRLSPHLHFGELSPDQVWSVVASRQPAAGEDAEHYLRELGWREFAHHVLYHFPETPREPLQPHFAAFPWRSNHQGLLLAWQRGQTGLPIVDAGMRQLWQTGWMHNRVRMIVASLLVKNIRAPWQKGAAWFWDTLLDADLASNTLGWQWAAGCGADAAPYFRIFNPVRQGEKFDPEGSYVRRWVPELAELPAKWIHQPWAAPQTALEQAGITLDETYPRPVVDLAESRKAALAALESLNQARRTARQS